MSLEDSDYDRRKFRSPIITVKTAIECIIEGQYGHTEDIDNLRQINSWLIDLLVQKGVITEEEFCKEFPRFRVK